MAIHRDDFNRARSEAPNLLTDQFTTVVPVPLRPPESEDPALVELQDELEPGVLMLRNRWDDSEYIHAAMAYERISLSKFNLFAEICQILGANRLDVVEIREVTEGGKISGSVKFNAGVASLSGGGGSERLRKIAQSVHGHWEWRGTPPDGEKAKAHARRAGISGDPVVAGLIRQRCDPGNKLTEYGLELDISSEAKHDIQAASGLMSMLKKLRIPGIDSTFEKLKSETERLVLSVEVVFPRDPAG
ncbi:hypothetical protein [Sinosporangium album]|uniref:hypothetical protein n=1 Tax=Sinosporangium album TaxID=504805 RepID=UPI00115F9572|nr:hypothetical protein [Sinosporangium album]